MRSKYEIVGILVVVMVLIVITGCPNHDAKLSKDLINKITKINCQGCTPQEGEGEAEGEIKGETDCSDLSDNDGDGNIDCADSDCTETVPCGDHEDSVVNGCADGIDNDGDSFVDCDDYDCSYHAACGGVELNCINSLDDDGDGFPDCDDIDCSLSSDCAK